MNKPLVRQNISSIVSMETIEKQTEVEHIDHTYELKDK